MEALEQLTLFTEASLDLAKTCQSRASKRDCPASAPASGSRCLELFPNSDPLTSLLRTCVERAISPCQPSYPVWREQATKCGQASFQLLRLERPISGKDSSSSESGAMWPTACASDYKGCGPHGSKSQKYMLAKSYLCATVSEAENSGLRPQSTETTTAAD